MRLLLVWLIFNALPYSLADNCPPESLETLADEAPKRLPYDPGDILISDQLGEVRVVRYVEEERAWVVSRRAFDGDGFRHESIVLRDQDANTLRRRDSPEGRALVFDRIRTRFTQPERLGFFFAAEGLNFLKSNPTMQKAFMEVAARRGDTRFSKFDEYLSRCLEGTYGTREFTDADVQLLREVSSEFNNRFGVDLVRTGIVNIAGKSNLRGWKALSDESPKAEGDTFLGGLISRPVARSNDPLPGQRFSREMRDALENHFWFAGNSSLKEGHIFDEKTPDGAKPPHTYSIGPYFTPERAADPFSQSIREFKDQPTYQVADEFASRLVTQHPELAKLSEKKNIRILPIPSSDRTTEATGLLSHALARQLKLPQEDLKANVTQDARGQKGQRTLADRIRNAADNMGIEKDLTGQTVIIVDDNYTSGATAENLRAHAYKQGAEKVIVVTISSTPRQNENPAPQSWTPQPKNVGKFQSPEIEFGTGGKIADRLKTFAADPSVNFERLPEDADNRSRSERDFSKALDNALKSSPQLVLKTFPESEYPNFHRLLTERAEELGRLRAERTAVRAANKEAGKAKTVTGLLLNAATKLNQGIYPGHAHHDAIDNAITKETNIVALATLNETGIRELKLAGQIFEGRARHNRERILGLARSYQALNKKGRRDVASSPGFKMLAEALDKHGEQIVLDGLTDRETIEQLRSLLK